MNITELLQAVFNSVNSISDNWNDNLQSLNREKMNHRYQSFTRIGRQFQSLECQVYVDWTSVSFPLCQRSCLIWRIMAKNDEYNDEYNDECRDFVVSFNLWSRLSFQISEFRVHWFHYTITLRFSCLDGMIVRNLRKLRKERKTRVENK